MTQLNMVFVPSVMQQSPDAFPSELVHYLTEKDYLPDAAIKSVYGISRGRQLVQENKDFIARFFRQNSY